MDLTAERSNSLLFNRSAVAGWATVLSGFHPELFTFVPSGHTEIGYEIT